MLLGIDGVNAAPEQRQRQDVCGLGSVSASDLRAITSAAVLSEARCVQIFERSCSRIEATRQRNTRPPSTGVAVTATRNLTPTAPGGPSTPSITPT